MTCQTAGCKRTPPPGFANCSDDTRRLLRQAFGSSTPSELGRSPHDSARSGGPRVPALVAPSRTG